MHKQLLAPAVVALAVMASSPASAAFCVNSLALDGTSATGAYNTLINSANGCASASQQGFSADELKGRYSGLLVVGATLTPNLLSFQKTTFLNWSEYVRDADSQPIDAASSLLGRQYNLYAVIRSAGMLTLSTGEFTANDARLEIWADPFNAPGAANTDRLGWDVGLNPVLTGAGDDKLLLTGVLDSGSGLAAAPGTFSFTFDSLSLRALGSSYFISPTPLSSLLRIAGNVDNNGLNVIAPGVFELSGGVNARFDVPEPGSLALASLALLGLGLAARRKTRA